MIKHIIQILSIMLVLGISTGSSASLLQYSTIQNNIIDYGLDLFSTTVTTSNFSVKQKPPYDKANDPAHRTNTEISEAPRPQHGYFAVPLIVIGLAGILLYFSKF